MHFFLSKNKIDSGSSVGYSVRRPYVFMNSFDCHYFDALPAELEHKIIGYVCVVIQRSWRRVLTRKNTATQFIQDLIQEAIYDKASYNFIPAYIEPDRIGNTLIIEFCEKALRGRKIRSNLDMWVEFGRMVRFGLDVGMYTGGPGAIWYNRTEDAFLNLASVIYEGLSPDQKSHANLWFG